VLVNQSTLSSATTTTSSSYYIFSDDVQILSIKNPSNHRSTGVRCQEGTTDANNTLCTCECACTRSSGYGIGCTSTCQSEEYCNNVTIAAVAVVGSIVMCGCCIGGGIYICLGKRQKNQEYFPAAIGTNSMAMQPGTDPNNFATTVGQQGWPAHQQQQQQQQQPQFAKIEGGNEVNRSVASHAAF
jgi:hypothetical protein